MSKPRRIWGFKTMLRVALRKDPGPEQYLRTTEEEERGASKKPEDWHLLPSFAIHTTAAPTYWPSL